MTSRWLIFRSLTHHARTHLLAAAGAMVAGAVLVGALAVGDSVRASLRQMALARLGRVEFALASGERLFRADLASDLQLGLQQGALGRPLAAPMAAALSLPGVAVTAEGEHRARQIQVLGVDPRFFALAPPAKQTNAPPTTAAPVGPDEVLLNPALAAQLAAKPGDTVILRVQKPSALSKDAPLSPEEDAAVALRLRVQAIIGDERLGNFNLRAAQLAPMNAFVALSRLQAAVKATGSANLLLAGAVSSPTPQPAMAGLMVAQPPPINFYVGLTNLLQQRWRLADAELEWRDLPQWRAVELRSRRVFLDPAVVSAVVGNGVGTNHAVARLSRTMPYLKASAVLTYFVNELRAGDATTPYSMVSAAAPPLVPDDLGEDEILLNQWLATDLNAKVGDQVTLKYFVVGTMRSLEERESLFRVRAILPMNTPGLDRDLMPDFPGMAGAKTCRDWDTGLPIQTDRIRPKDEEYWRDYKGTPKALISLKAGQRLWANRFGDLTAVRFYTAGGLPAPGLGAAPSQPLTGYRSAVERQLLAILAPESVGLRLEEVRAQALAASSQGQDFGGLFLGFSFFLMGAALLLIYLLFHLAIERRAGEAGLLLALGFRPGMTSRLFLKEGTLVALVGVGLGTWAGTGYAKLMLRGLSTIWSEAVGGAALAYHAEPRTLATGAGCAIALSMLTMWLVTRRFRKASAARLLAEGGLEEQIDTQRPGFWSTKAGWLATGATAAALVLAIASAAAADTAAPLLFFGAGALLLTAGLAGARAWLGALACQPEDRKLSLALLALREVTRRPKRSLSTLGLLASGAFLVGAIGVFRLETPSSAGERSAGTGGFALLAESAQPVVHDLNTARGLEALGLETNVLQGASVVPFRVREGDDASCLNLNRAQVPRLLGVEPRLLQERKAFTFAGAASGLSIKDGWEMLVEARKRLPADEVPAIGDAASIQYALGSKVGGAIPYRDEAGRPFKLRLVGAVANSILQGQLIISEQDFVARFPSASGYRFFLMDAPPERADAVAKDLTRGLRDAGMEVSPTLRRLAALNAVQNTYLGTFQILGGLGILLGSAGLGLVLVRNVLERKGELAVLLALGYQEKALARVVLVEHVGLLVAGLGIGAVAAGVAVMPALMSPGGHVPWQTLGLTGTAILTNGLFWAWVATRWALRGRIIEALRNA